MYMSILNRITIHLKYNKTDLESSLIILSFKMGHRVGWWDYIDQPVDFSKAVVIISL